MSTGSPHRTNKPSVEIQILGQRMVLKACDDPHRLERLVAYINRKIDELSANGPLSSSKLAALVALNVADDYFNSLDDIRELKKGVAQRSRTLLHDLDRQSVEHVRVRDEAVKSDK